jgi:hypothetical protein
MARRDPALTTNEQHTDGCDTVTDGVATAASVGPDTHAPIPSTLIAVVHRIGSAARFIASMISRPEKDRVSG